jgi:hypothetical protein
MCCHGNAINKPLHSNGRLPNLTQSDQQTFFTTTSQGTWARSYVEKEHTFDEHLANAFQPHPSENQPEEEE